VVRGRGGDHHGEGRETLEAAMVGGEAAAHGGGSAEGVGFGADGGGGGSEFCLFR
jgi:hypothetical protein